ncbi:MAG: hypothetical protein EPO51_21110 [Phenylobacterium sp.]|uniref:hypothetical protein n=1 Tax=Phenylobacterium sp. TaxID=1871053 RepID=UPI00121D6954|nr:hypothetical protein [Phenylobacterium sp.]TAJ70021.1 MAG: hypothetical protein EPO51_21110 [Phenylobacterium sp.]
MTEAAPPIDRDAEMLARLAEMDFSAAEHVHAKLVAASDTDEIAELSRSYHRVSRALRQTLALKAKLARDEKAAASDAALRRVMLPPTREGFATDDPVLAVGLVLQDAVERIVGSQCAGDEERITSLLTRFDRELDDWVCEEDFADVDLDAHVRRACKLLDLPEDLAAVWPSLPRPTFSPDPPTNDPPTDDTAGAPQPRSSSA